MDEIVQEGEAYADLIPTILRHRDSTGELREGLADRLAREFRDEVSTLIDRWSCLPDVHTWGGPHTPLLLEARDLYRCGHFYSCVAMCGITSERIVKDLLHKHLALRIDGKIARVPEDAMEEIEKFGFNAIARFLEKAGVINSVTYEAISRLAKLRNKYAHGVGKKHAEVDALNAIRLLHEIIDGTVSVFPADFEQPEYGPQCDVVEGASGTFGLERSNPIPGDARAYCKRLRCPSGHPYWFHRLGSIGQSSPDGHTLDRVELLCFGREQASILYFDVYHAGFSNLTPTGMTLGPPEGRGVMGRVLRFPEDLTTRT